jgi:hypothetical protein
MISRSCPGFDRSASHLTTKPLKQARSAWEATGLIS